MISTEGFKIKLVQMCKKLNMKIKKNGDKKHCCQFYKNKEIFLPAGNNLLNKFNELNGFKLVLFGNRQNSETLVTHLKNNGLTVSYFVDINNSSDSDKLLNENKEKLKIIITYDYPAYEKIMSQLTEMGLGSCIHDIPLFVATQ